MADLNQLVFTPEELEGETGTSNNTYAAELMDYSPANQLSFSPEELEGSAENQMNLDTGTTDAGLDDKLSFSPEELEGTALPSSSLQNNRAVMTDMAGAFGRGLRSSASGQVLGAEQPSGEVQGFLNHVAHLGGSLLGDIPAFKGGASLGAIIGGTIGSAVPVLGTALGASLGAAFFGMAAPVAIKMGFNKYKEFKRKGGEGSFEDFIKGAGEWATETGKAGALGLATANLSRFLPVLNKMPVFNKILKTNIGSKLTARGVELVGLTGAQSLIDRQLPTAAQWRDNALVIAYMDLAGAMGTPIRAYTPEFIKRAPGKALEKLPKFIREPIQRGIAYKEDIQQKVQNKQYFDWLKDSVGERQAKIIGDQMDIMSKTQTLNKKGQRVDKWSPQVMEDLIYARQKTGNPNIKGDTYKDVLARTPKDAQRLLKEYVGPFFENIRQEVNADPRLKDIAFRENYMPGLFEGDASKMVLPKNFSLHNAFANPKKFNTFMEAARKAGLKPRFKDIRQFMALYADTTTKLLAKSKLVGQINEANQDGNLIVRSNNKNYDKLKRSGNYVEMQDEWLRRVPTTEGTIVTDAQGVPKIEQKQVWKLTERPALVDKRFADAFQGVFAKDAPTSENPVWRKLDTAANVIKTAKTAASGFHIVSLVESAVGALGKKGFNIPRIVREGKNLQQNKKLRVDYARHGGVLGNPIDYGRGFKAMDSALDFIGSKTGRIGKAATGKLKKAANWVFDSFHTNLKLVTYNELVKNQVVDAGLKGKEATQAKRQIAEFVNNIYGGQNWETSKWFNDPKTLRRLRRSLSFSDWTISALKQAGGTLKGGAEGARSRKYLGKYLVTASIMQSALKYLFGGIEQTDKKNNSPAGIRWSREKAAKEFFQGDPTKWYQFSLPDANVKIGPTTLNLGRDLNNKKMYGHFGKQFLEILGYGTQPTATLFSKSNPIFQMAYQQLVGSTLSADGSYPARGKYDEGEFKPWDATKPYTAGRAVSRAKALAHSVSPFSLSTLVGRGVGPYIGSAGGSFPVSQGMSLRKSRRYIKKALLNRDGRELDRIRRILLNNGYKDKSIKATITKVKKEIRS